MDAAGNGKAERGDVEQVAPRSDGSAARVRLGVVGLGLIWLRAHKPILATLQDVFQVVALCDTSEQRRLTAAQEFPWAQVYSAASELLALPDVDAVLVLTPLALNAVIAKAALAAGKDVIMEKPIATSVAAGRELIELARRMGRRVMVLEQLAYRTLEERLMELLAAGVIGRAVFWERIHHADVDPQQGELRYDSTAWRKAGDFPLGALFDAGIHLIASLSRVFGAPESVYATGQKFRQGYGDYDHTTMTLRYSGGLVGVFSFSSCMTSLQDHYVIHGREGAILIERESIIVKRPDQSDQVLTLSAENYYERMWEHIVRALRQGVAPEYSAEKALADVATLEAVARSLKSGASELISSPCVIDS